MADQNSDNMNDVQSADAKAVADTDTDMGAGVVDDAVDAASSSAAAATDDFSPAADPPPADFGSAAPAALPGEFAGIDLLHDVNLHVTIELGRARMLVEDVLRLGDGSVIELDKLAGDPVDVYVNQRLVARGEVLVLNDNFCIRISEIVADLEEQAQAAAAAAELQESGAATN